MQSNVTKLTSASVLSGEITSYLQKAVSTVTYELAIIIVD